MPPLVSILIPAYNAQSWIADTIHSALAQTWSRTEVIVVNDGSTDRTLQMARAFTSKKVLVVTQPNQGASAARNKALSLCQGDYVQWLDADDLLSSDKIAKQIEVAEECGGKRTLLSSAWGAFMYRVSKARFLPTALWHDHLPVEWLLGKMGENLHMQTATWLVSRELTEAAGPWDPRLSLDDDGEYFCRVVLASQAIRFVTNAKVFYRNSNLDSLSNIDRSDKKLESQFRSMKLHISHIRRREDSERVRTACVKYLQTWFIWFYEERADLALELERLAATLGGRLEVPQLRRKYRWIQRVGGRGLARRVQYLLPRVKWILIGLWDRVLSRAERKGI